jgi:hypothetical protein
LFTFASIKLMRKWNFIILVFTLLFPLRNLAGAQRWTEAKANAWYAKQPWLIGSNFVPSDAVNALEMWQADTFDPREIDRELGWAENIGMNTMRVFLPYILWDKDPEGFKNRIDAFLNIAERHHIRPMLVLFDSCWDPSPKLGPQHPPIPGVHNSGWVQSPGAATLQDPSQYPHLKAYVQRVVGAFANDARVLAWDVWNEPNNIFTEEPYAKFEAKDKLKIEQTLLPQVFGWARSVMPIQPLTSGLWQGGDFSTPNKLTQIEQIQLQESDVLSFHNYSWPEDFEREVVELEGYHRPIICTEYMARPLGSTFDTILPLAKTHNVGAINASLVFGKTQAYLPWNSWHHPYVQEQPDVWFHDVFYPDGRPYREQEIKLIRQLSRDSSRERHQ